MGGQRPSVQSVEGYHCQYVLNALHCMSARAEITVQDEKLNCLRCLPTLSFKV